MPTMKSYSHIFFDLDRTLWDFDKNSSDTLREIIDQFNLTTQVNDAETFIASFHQINEHLWGDYRKGKIKKYNLRLERFRRLLAKYCIEDITFADKLSSYYLHNCPLKSALIDGSKEVLQYLSPNYKLYILSNGFYDVQMTKMINSGISRYFIKLFTSDRIGYSKPKAGIFEYAIRSENAKKEQAIVIGDDITNDIQGARNVNIDQVFYNPLSVKCAIAPTYEIHDLLDLKNIL
jgi:putative hydrolase of the HAD superfamily